MDAPNRVTNYLKYDRTRLEFIGNITADCKPAYSTTTNSYYMVGGSLFEGGIGKGYFQRAAQAAARFIPGNITDSQNVQKQIASDFAEIATNLSDLHQDITWISQRKETLHEIKKTLDNDQKILTKMAVGLNTLLDTIRKGQEKEGKAERIKNYLKCIMDVADQQQQIKIVSSKIDELIAPPKIDELIAGGSGYWTPSRNDALNQSSFDILNELEESSLDHSSLDFLNQSSLEDLNQSSLFLTDQSSLNQNFGAPEKISNQFLSGSSFAFNRSNIKAVQSPITPDKEWAISIKKLQLQDYLDRKAQQSPGLGYEVDLNQFLNMHDFQARYALLHFAIDKNDPELFNLFLEAGAKLVSHTFNYSQKTWEGSLVNLAIEKGNTDVFLPLIVSHGMKQNNFKVIHELITSLGEDNFNSFLKIKGIVFDKSSYQEFCNTLNHKINKKNSDRIPQKAMAAPDPQAKKAFESGNFSSTRQHLLLLSKVSVIDNSINPFLAAPNRGMTMSKQEKNAINAEANKSFNQGIAQLTPSDALEIQNHAKDRISHFFIDNQLDINKADASGNTLLTHCLQKLEGTTNQQLFISGLNLVKILIQVGAERQKKNNEGVDANQMIANILTNHPHKALMVL